MKLLLLTVLIAGAAFCSNLFLPWWSIAPSSFIVATLIDVKPFKAFLCGFFALFFLWGGLSWWISNANDHLLAGKLGLVILQSNQPFKLIIITALIGGLIGAFSALTGSLARSLFVLNENK